MAHRRDVRKNPLTKITIKRFLLTLGFAAAMAVPALAYEVPTHRVITDSAVRRT